MNNTVNSIKKATVLNAFAKYSTVIMQLVYTAILSRILTPDEYGIVAIINVFIIFFQLFADMGLGTAVIQNKNLSKEEINDIFTYSIYMGILLLVLFSLFSIPLSSVYNNRIYIPLGMELSFSLMFNSFNMIPNAVLLKNKNFYAIALRTIVVSIVSFSATIIFAIQGFGVYALAANSVISAFLIFIWNEATSKLRFNFHPRMNSLKKIWNYSMFQFGAQVLNYFNRNLDNLLIGKFFSAADLGQYNKAYTLTRYPITYLPGVITPVLHPFLSEHQDNPTYIYDKYMKLLKPLSLLGCFGAAFCYFAGEEIILIAFGKQWGAAVLPFKILSLSLWMQILTNTVGPIYQSLGNTRLMFKSTVINTIIIVSAILVGTLGNSIDIVSTTVSTAYIINFFVSFYILITQVFKHRFSLFLCNFTSEVFMFGGFMVATLIWPFNIHNHIVSLIVKLVAFGAIYMILLIITKQYKSFLAIIRKK